MCDEEKGLISTELKLSEGSNVFDIDLQKQKTPCLSCPKKSVSLKGLKSHKIYSIATIELN